MSDTQVVVDFRQPVEGIDPFDGVPIVADRHRLDADSMRLDKESLSLFDARGEPVAEWSTAAVSTITWPSSNQVLHFGEIPPIPSGPERQGEPWSLEEDEQLREEFVHGMARKDIAAAHHRSYGAISNRLKKLGLID